jgi:glycosyltransferase involved in cell wall biosynthesis
MTVGATIPIYHLIKQLGKKHDITLVSFNSNKYSLDEIEEFLTGNTCMDIPSYLDLKNQLKYTLKNMLSLDNLNTRSILNYYYHPKMKRIIEDNLSENVDLIITDMPMAFYVKESKIPKIVYAFDAVSDYNYKMYQKSEKLPSKMYWYLNYLKIHRYEKDYNKFDYCIVVNDKDKELLKKDVKIPIEVIPNGVDTRYFKNDDNEDDLKLVFLGDMSTPPNNDAIKYFIDNIFHELLKKVSINLYIVGRNPSEYIKSLETDPNIVVTGPVDDVRTYLTKNTIFITPMISGTGIKNKILEAMSMQLPVVSTSIGISGIEAENNVEYLLADSSEEFMYNIIKLINDSKLREFLGFNARVFVEKKYSWKHAMDKFDIIIKEIIT